jgi:hypothetical protein
MGTIQGYWWRRIHPVVTGRKNRVLSYRLELQNKGMGAALHCGRRVEELTTGWA